jgi:hypothetical protein
MHSPTHRLFHPVLHLAHRSAMSRRSAPSPLTSQPLHHQHHLHATSPRSGLAAHDATKSYGADSYAYSGQSFVSVVAAAPILR